MRILLTLHAILLLLASTKFTIITAFFGNSVLQWCYFKYASSNGWGFKYVSDYNVAEIVTYLLGFTVGAIGFFAASKRGHLVVGVLGVSLSLIGILSFAIEGSHWIVDHNRSWVAFSPVAMLVLVIWVCLPRRLVEEEKSKATSMYGIDVTPT